MAPRHRQCGDASLNRGRGAPSNVLQGEEVGVLSKESPTGQLQALPPHPRHICSGRGRTIENAVHDAQHQFPPICRKPAPNGTPKHTTSTITAGQIMCGLFQHVVSGTPASVVREWVRVWIHTLLQQPSTSPSVPWSPPAMVALSSAAGAP